MDKSSPWYQFDPTSVGWLLRKHEAGEPISAEDVRRIVTSDRKALHDPIVGEYVVNALNGQLNMPAGRPKRTASQEAKILFAPYLVESLVEDWRSGSNGSLAVPPPEKGRGMPSLTEAAYEHVARYLGFGSGKSLANAVSTQKSRANKVTAVSTQR